VPLSVGAVALELLEELAFDEDAALEEALLLEADEEALLEELLAFEEDAALEDALLEEELAALDEEEEALLDEAELAALEEEEEAELLLPEHLEATSSARPLPAPA
jgi:hypothetical protein